MNIIHGDRWEQQLEERMDEGFDIMLNGYSWQSCVTEGEARESASAGMLGTPYGVTQKGGPVGTPAASSRRNAGIPPLADLATVVEDANVARSGGAVPVAGLPGSNRRVTGVPSGRKGSKKIPHGAGMRDLAASNDRSPSPCEARMGFDSGTTSQRRRDSGRKGEDRVRPRSPGDRRSREVVGLAPRRTGLAEGSRGREGVEEPASVGSSVPGRRAGPCLAFVDEDPRHGTRRQAESPGEEDGQSSILNEDDSSAHTYVPSDGCDGHWWLRWSPAQRAAWSEWHDAGHTSNSREAYHAETGHRWCDDWDLFEGHYGGRRILDPSEGQAQVRVFDLTGRDPGREAARSCSSWETVVPSPIPPGASA